MGLKWAFWLPKTLASAGWKFHTDTSRSSSSSFERRRKEAPAEGQESWDCKNTRWAWTCRRCSNTCSMGTLTSLKENWLFSHIGLLVLFLILWYCIWSKWVFQQLKVWWWPISKRQSLIFVHIVATVTCYVNVCDMAQASILTQLVAAAWRKFEGFFRKDQHVLADGSIWSYPAYWQRASERWFWLGRWPLQGASACPWWGISLPLCCLVLLRPKFFFLISLDLLTLLAAINAVPKVLILSNLTYVATSTILKQPT